MTRTLSNIWILFLIKCKLKQGPFHTIQSDSPVMLSGGPNWNIPCILIGQWMSVEKCPLTSAAILSDLVRQILMDGNPIPSGISSRMKPDRRSSDSPIENSGVLTALSLHTEQRRSCHTPAQKWRTEYVGGCGQCEWCPYLITSVIF